MPFFKGCLLLRIALVRTRTERFVAVSSSFKTILDRTLGNGDTILLFYPGLHLRCAPVLLHKVKFFKKCLKDRDIPFGIALFKPSFCDTEQSIQPFFVICFKPIEDGSMGLPSAHDELSRYFFLEDIEYGMYSQTISPVTGVFMIFSGPSSLCCLFTILFFAISG